ncbi:hypothetical protein AK88_04569 [Plasmodium fragile]|uniref:Plasmodium RESA N-terminal domain-containing protein n=1 Tax=Plasmodium fragile TaxID=5857 RepID=A0A0D9QFI7_PLAFR|nr:uncharacterized protein AK88_04569 [Plasmodium fragile]KJP85810.1 hypothetical protein AK88_04569 [Plasmodium fragile]
MMFHANLSIFSSILYSKQYFHDLIELGTSWKNTAEQNDTLGVRISRLLMVEVDMQTPEQNNTLPDSPSRDPFKEPIVQAKEEAAKDKRPFLRGETNVPSGEPTQQSEEHELYKRQYVPVDSIPDHIIKCFKPYEDISHMYREEPKKEKKKKMSKDKLRRRNNNVNHRAFHKIDEYEELIDRSLKYDEKGHRDKRDEFLSGDSRKLDRNGTDNSIAFHYEMTCFDERLTDYDINEKLEQIEEEPHTCELLSLYWQSHRNEKGKYLSLKKSLKQKLLELQKEQTIATHAILNKQWKQCEQIINNNLTKQHEHVSDVFYTMVAKENWSTHEFEKILYDFRETWKQVTTKAADECIAIIGEPISLEVIYDENDPHVLGMRVPGFTVPGMPYGSRGKLDSKVGSEGLLVATQNEAQVEETEEKPRGLYSSLARTLRRNKIWIPSPVILFCLYIYMIFDLVFGAPGSTAFMCVYIVAKGTILILLIVPLRLYYLKEKAKAA